MPSLAFSRDKAGPCVGTALPACWVGLDVGLRSTGDSPVAVVELDVLDAAVV